MAVKNIVDKPTANELKYIKWYFFTVYENNYLTLYTILTIKSSCQREKRKYERDKNNRNGTVRPLQSRYQ